MAIAIPGKERVKWLFISKFICILERKLYRQKLGSIITEYTVRFPCGYVVNIHSIDDLPAIAAACLSLAHRLPPRPRPRPRPLALSSIYGSTLALKVNFNHGTVVWFFCVFE